jgi:hypothetical protein
MINNIKTIVYHRTLGVINFTTLPYRQNTLTIDIVFYI